MIKIKCSILEQVRRNPTAHAQMLASGGKDQRGGPPGMFGHWKNLVKKVHTSELSLNDGIKELQNKFSQFQDNLANKTKQTKLLDEFVTYCEKYNQLGFKFADTRHNINWEIVPTITLTGHSPWVVYDSNFYYAYFLVETPIDWQAELRFPLIQTYLANNTIECDVAELKVGIYALSTQQFELKSFTEEELIDAFAETSTLFHNVHSEYNKFKK